MCMHVYVPYVCPSNPKFHRDLKFEIMENDQNKPQISASVSPPQNVTIPNSSPPRSNKKTGEHISLSPPVGSPGNSSLDSDHITISPSHVAATGNEIPFSPEKMLPLVVVNRNASIEPTQNRVVLEEPADIEKTVVEEPKAVVTKTDTDGGVQEGGGGGSRRPKFKTQLSILQRTERENMVKKAALGFRIFGLLFCLVSIAVMAANVNQGWALDSFYRYKEFRYCMSVSVIGFLYSGAQTIELSYNLATGKYIIHHQQQLRGYFDFAADQMIAYLLISASSSAAIRVDDWQSNWGNDKFPSMATAAISASFLGFIAMAFSSLISGYVLCTSKSL